MANPHQALGRFFDGELPDSEVDGFRQHLATCKECQAELDELMQLDALGLRHLQLMKVPRVVQLKPVRRSPPWWTWMAAGVALAAAVVLVVNRPGNQVPDSLWAPREGGRLADARSSYQRASQHRPLERTLGDEHKLPPLPMQQLAKLEGDHLAVASALLARAEISKVDDALRELESLDSADADSERAMAYLIREDAVRLDHESALRWAERALQKKPDHAAALWNKALALEKLGLTMSAAKVFDQVIRLGEPGWSAEAKQRADALKDTADKAHARWRQAEEASKALVKGAVSVPPDSLQVPVVRPRFYDAVLSRRSKDEVLALLPLADQLDRQSGGTHLHEWVQRVSERPLAADQFRRLAVDKDESVIPELWKSREDDVAVSAMLHATKAFTAEELAGLEQRAGRLEDPWFRVAVLQKRAAHLESKDLQAARKELERAIELAEASGLTDKSLEARIDLIVLVGRASDLEGARSVAAKTWDLAVAADEWHVQRQVLELLAQLARFRREATIARAYFGEAVERSAEEQDKDHERSVREMLGMLEIEQLRFKVAREQVDGAIRTGSTLGINGASVIADVTRHFPSPGDEKAMEAFRGTVGKMPPGTAALATEILGRWKLKTNPEEGRKLLQSAITQAAATAGSDASRARTFAYSALIMDAAERKDFGRVLELFSEEAAGASFPATCAVALAINVERSAVVVRGPSGAFEGEYRGDRTESVPDKLDGLVSPRLAAMLGGCREVKVVARPPAFGRLGALPITIPWSYLLLNRGAARPPVAASGPGTHLVVQSVAVPSRFLRQGLKVPQPLVTKHPYPTDLTVLEGARATPNQILAELRTASVVDFVTHSVINPMSGEASLVTAEGPEGDTLTATQLRGAQLQNRPFVTLSACHAARSAPVLYEARSLPAAFLLAGASAVFAVDDEVPEKGRPELFNAVRARILQGVPPAVALRDVRQEALAKGKVSSWIERVLLFE
jgi:cellulose synthase operon protein C